MNTKVSANKSMAYRLLCVLLILACLIGAYNAYVVALDESLYARRGAPVDYSGVLGFVGISFVIALEMVSLIFFRVFVRVWRRIVKEMADLVS